MCVAGIDLDTGEHVRPELSAGRMPVQLLARYGGPFDIGAVVDIGAAFSLGRVPEVEDCRCFVGAFARSAETSDVEFWDLLSRSAKTDLGTIFGPELGKPTARSCGVNMGKGMRSLGCLRPSHACFLQVRHTEGQRTSVRMLLHDVMLGDLDLAVNDLRLFGSDHATADEARVVNVQEHLAHANDTILSVGLTREFRGVHWLQVNNIHFSGRPVWREATGWEAR